MGVFWDFPSERKEGVQHKTNEKNMGGKRPTLWGKLGQRGSSAKKHGEEITKKKFGEEKGKKRPNFQTAGTVPPAGPKKLWEKETKHGLNTDRGSHREKLGGKKKPPKKGVGHTGMVRFDKSPF